MTNAERWLLHWQRILQGSLSAEQRTQAEAERAYWRAQARRQAA